MIGVILLGGAYGIEALVYDGPEKRRALVRMALAAGTCYLMVRFGLVVLPNWLVPGQL